MPIWVINFIYSRVQDGFIIVCSNWNAIFFLQTFENASKLRAFAISGKIHFHIQVCIVKDIRFVVLIISLRDFIIVLDTFKFFAKVAIILNKFCPMVGVGLIPYVSIFTADFYSLLHVLIELLKRILYLCSRLLGVGDPLNV